MYSPKVLHSQIKDVTCGENVTIIEPANVYGCELKEGVFVGPFVEIQKNTVIGERTKIQSHTFICEYVTIGNVDRLTGQPDKALDVDHSGFVWDPKY